MLLRTGPTDHLLAQMSRLDCFRDENQASFQSLTARERQVLGLVADGLSNPQIADHINISRVTVQNHRANIRQKLNMNSQAEYIKYALAFDLIQF